MFQVSSAEWLDTGSRMGCALIGCTEDGRSACVFVTACPLYFFLILNKELSDAQRNSVYDELDEAISARIPRCRRPQLLAARPDWRTPADHYRPGPAPALRLEFATPRAAQEAKRLLGAPSTTAGSGSWPRELERALGSIESPPLTADARVTPEARALLDAGLSPEDWISLPAGGCRGGRVSRCALEAHVDFSKLGALRVEKAGAAPKRVLALALRTLGSGGDAGSSLVAAAVSYCRTSSPGDAEQQLFVLERDEKLLLRQLSAAISAADPDVVVVHGARRRGFRWLQAAGERLGVDAFESWGRLNDTGMTLEPDAADEDRVQSHVSGRIVLDIEAWAQRSLKLRDYELGALCEHVGAPAPSRMDRSARREAERSPEGRAALGAEAAAECAAVLAVVFSPSLAPIDSMLAYASVTGCTAAAAAVRGTQFVLFQKLLRIARNRPERFVFPDPEVKRKPPHKEDKKRKSMAPVFSAQPAKKADPEEGSFKGGRVLPAKPGLYGLRQKDERRRGCVAVVDFGSLYPSIMRADSICPTTRLTMAEALAAGIPVGDIVPAPWSSGAWVDPEGREVVLPPADDDAPRKLPDGRTARLALDEFGRALGQKLELSDGTTWTRSPRDTLVFVTPSVLEGLLPGMLKELKVSYFFFLFLPKQKHY